MDAILYTSNAGTTEQYAKLLSEKTGIPVFPLKDTTLPCGSEIIYLGWVIASGVKGYKKAASNYNVKALCGVCMGRSGSQLTELKKANNVADGVPVFTFQGGFDITKLHGVYKFMMRFMSKTVGKALAKKTDRTEEEDEMLNMMLNGANYVSEENLKPLLDILPSL